MGGNRGRGIAGVAIFVLVIAGAFLLLARPTIPESALGSPFTRTSLLPPDPSEEPIQPGLSGIVGSDCPARIMSGRFWADLCWLATRQEDGDAATDQFTLSVYGTFGRGARWMVAEARLIEGSPLRDPEGEPQVDGGGCHVLPAGLLPLPGEIASETLCGRVAAGPGANPGSWRIAWTCEPCWPFDDADRAIGFQTAVTVPEGTLPNWDLAADLGE